MRHNYIAAVEHCRLFRSRRIHRHVENRVTVFVINLNPELVVTFPGLVPILDVSDKLVVAYRLDPVWFLISSLPAEGSPPEGRVGRLSKGQAVESVALYSIDRPVGKVPDEQQTALHLGAALIVLHGEPEVGLLIRVGPVEPPSPCGKS